RVSQIQLVQIFFTIAFSALFFGEHIEPITWVFACGVIITVMLGRKTAVQPAPACVGAGLSNRRTAAMQTPRSISKPR
ncbi:MAG: EamA/RhaT family transporter, partial [Pseudomonas fluorescens]|nr:EamA/RhaT family transporter [Pseudomonas fluorescens]